MFGVTIKTFGSNPIAGRVRGYYVERSWLTGHGRPRSWGEPNKQWRVTSYDYDRARWY